MERPTLELADVVRACQATLCQRYPLTWDQRRALHDVARCRTAALGGHVQSCAGCGHGRIAYNSCRNRHCPKCLASQQALWLSREAENLLPVEYHHVVFTLPAEVNSISLANPRTVYEALLAATAQTIAEVAANPRHLGAEVGVLLVLHTWGQTLSYHPHVHAVATGGGLTPEGRWRSCRPGFFLPVRVLSRVFRGKFLARMRQVFAAGQLAGFADRAAFQRWLTNLESKEWVVYSKPPFGGPQQTLKYLARYTHRVAIGNSRLQSFESDRVTFTYKDYSAQAKSKSMTLSGEEFLRRWVQHVLPRGFVKIRHCGLLANRQRQRKLAECRRLLLGSSVSPLPQVPEAQLRPDKCPVCGRQAWLIGARFEPFERPALACVSRVCNDSS